MTTPPPGEGTMGAHNLAAEAAARGPWFHNLHLPGGVETAPDHPLGDFPRFKWAPLSTAIPADLRSWRALDIGCNGGFYTFELARRGAMVVALDHDPHYLDQARWAAEIYGLADRIEFRQQQLFALARVPEQFDLVWFMGVVYHLRYPLLALDIVARLTRRLLVFQTLTMPDRSVRPIAPDYGIDERGVLALPGWPKMAFVERRFANDPTNWWIPNAACAEAMLRSAGLRILARPAHETYVCEPDSTSTARADTEAEYRAALGIDSSAATSPTGPERGFPQHPGGELGGAVDSVVHGDAK